MDDFFSNVRMPPPKFEPDQRLHSPYLTHMLNSLPVIQRPSAIVKTSVDLMPSVEIIPSPYLTERRQVIFPKTRKKRLLKKFAKNPRNWADVPSGKVIVMGRKYIMHPAMIEQLKAEVLTINADKDRITVEAKNVRMTAELAAIHEAAQEVAIERVRRLLGA